MTAENRILAERQAGADADQFLQQGIICSAGRTMPPDMIAAHKWFNIAGMRGSSEAVRLRCEIASEMSSADIAAAQRARGSRGIKKRDPFPASSRGCGRF